MFQPKYESKLDGKHRIYFSKMISFLKHSEPWIARRGAREGPLDVRKTPGKTFHIILNFEFNGMLHFFISCPRMGGVDFDLSDHVESKYAFRKNKLFFVKNESLPLIKRSFMHFTSTNVTNKS